MSAFGDLIPHKSFKGKLIHKLAKPILMNAFSYMEGTMEELVQEKQKSGWVNPPIELLYNILTEVIEQDEICRLPADQYDPVRSMWINLRNAGCTILDEDSHYAMRVMYVMDQIAEKWPQYKKDAEKAQWVMDWERIASGLAQKKLLQKTPGAIEPMPLSVMRQKGILKETPEGTLVIDNDK